MAIYKNIDGTTKSSFKIGARGITIIPTAVIKGEETLMKVAIKEKGKDPRFLLYEDEVEIPKAYCTGIRQVGTQTIFSIRNEDGSISEIVINTREMGVKGPDGAVENNLAAFKDSTGQEIKDSGVSVKNTIQIDSSTNKASESDVPTAAAVVDYIGSINDLLALRVGGKF